MKPYLNNSIHITKIVTVSSNVTIECSNCKGFKGTIRSEQSNVKDIGTSSDI